MTLPAIPETPLPPDRPHVAECHCCKQWVPEGKWDDCAECQKPTCPRCLTELDVATVGERERHWGTTRAVKLCLTCAVQHVECWQCGRLFMDRKGNELCSDHDLED